MGMFFLIQWSVSIVRNKSTVSHAQSLCLSVGEKYQMAGKGFAFPIIEIILLAPESLKSSFPNLVNDSMHTLDFITNTIELLIKKNNF